MKEFDYKQRPITKEYEQNYELINWRDKNYDVGFNGNNYSSDVFHNLHGITISKKGK